MTRYLALVLFACTTDPRDSPPRPPPPPPPRPVPVPVPVPPVPAPSPPRATPSCIFYGALEAIEIKTDLATMTGTLERISTGVNHSRQIKYRLVADTPTSYDLVFAGYGASDYSPIVNWDGPSPPRERMTPGRSIVAHLAVAGGETRMFEREVDLHTGMKYQTRDHSLPCAFIDGDYMAAHPGAFLR